MQRSPLSLRIGGTTYKVHATAPEGEMRRLAEAVDEKLRQINPHNRPVTPQMFLLVALSFAHEAQQERDKRRDVEVETRQMLETIVERIDAALVDAAAADDEGPARP